MVKLVVHGDVKATCTQRILILLEELDLKYQFKHVDLRKKEQKDEKFMQMQPFGKIPVVEYGDRVLFESRAIMRYIAKNNRDEEFDLYGDVYTDIWMEAESQNFNPPASKIVSELVFKKWAGSKPDDDIVEKETENLEKVLDVYNKVLENRDYISGDNYTIADITYIPYAYQLLKCGLKETIKKRENVYAWLKRIMRRPAVRAVLEGKIPVEEDEDDDEDN